MKRPSRRSARIGDDDVEEGALLRAATCKSDHDHDVIPDLRVIAAPGERRPAIKATAHLRRTPRRCPRTVAETALMPSSEMPCVRPSTAADVPTRSPRIYAWNVLHGTRHVRARAARRGRDGAPPRRRARQGPALAGARKRRPVPAMPTPARSARGRPTASASRTRSTWRRRAPARASAGCCWPSCSPAARPRGARQMLAVIGDSANAGVDRRAPRLGFEPAGMMHARGLEVRALARRRADAAGPRARATRPRRPAA